MERHLFIALQLHAAVKSKLHQMCQEIKKDHSFKSWVHPEDYHITLAFLGKAERDQLKKLNPLLQETAMKHEPFTLNINQFGFFGNKEYPRIFWAGVEEQVKLYNLQENVAGSCRQAEFTLEKRPYSPHITLARKYLTETTMPIDSVKWWKRYGREVQFQAENIVLYETHFEKQPKYQILQSFSLTR